MSKAESISIFWFRRDLRLEDNHGLYQALQAGKPVLPLFIFDWNILNELPDSRDARVQFLHQEINTIKKDLENTHGSSVLIKYGKPAKVWEEVVQEYPVENVFCNRDYEPYAKKRDKHLYEWFRNKNINFKGYKDHVIFEKDEVLKDDGDPYVVYTPYMKRYKSHLKEEDLESYPVKQYAANFLKTDPLATVSLAEMGFQEFEFNYPSRKVDNEIIRNYHETRDIPSIEGTTRLSMHLRHGTISVRKLAKIARDENPKFFNELIWRDFYQSILYHYPHSLNQSFRPQYDAIEWENNEEHFKAWCKGKTGYPLVDAGMRELNESGFMHNRIRMLVSSFLTKHLLIDWRWGEQYFAQKLLDYEAASNVGGWQWAAGSGVDAAPYFRIFNPELQLKKFDPDFKYVKKWVSEFGTDDYPEPIVVHKEARERALNRFREALN
jgi:deoxyribodipyrimidine photo-lyase